MTTLNTISFSKPFPPKNAAGAMRQRLIDYLVESQPQPGSKFCTEAELVEATRLSRSTVRRALGPLVEQGWLDRRVGDGTYIGPHVGRKPLRIGSKEFGSNWDQFAKAGSTHRSRPRVTRMAVLIYNIGDLSHDWYTPLILEGINAAAEAHHISVELLGDHDADAESISRRLMRSQPDVLAVLSNDPRHAFVIRDAQKVGIHCLVTGTPHLGLGIPAILEDNRQAMRLAVEHLLQLGHTSISAIIQRTLEPWALDRHEAFSRCLLESGIADVESSVHWIDRHESRNVSAETVERVGDYLDRRQPTAVIAASAAPMVCLDRLHRAGRFEVPRDMSIVSFEQDLVAGHWLGGLTPTLVKCPLTEMGRQLAELATRMVADRELVSLEPTVLPAELVLGDTTTPPPALRK